MSYPHRRPTEGSEEPEAGFRLLKWFAAAAGGAAVIALTVAAVFPVSVVIPRLPIRREDPTEFLVQAAVLCLVLLSWALAEARALHHSVSTPRPPMRDVLGIALLLSFVTCIGWLVFGSVEAIALGGPRPFPPGVGMPVAGAAGSWIVVLLVALISWLHRRRMRDPARHAAVQQAYWAVMVAFLLIPQMWNTVYTFVAAPALLIWCIPTTTLALLGIHLMQLHLRMPLRMLLAAFGWGAFIAIGVSAVNLSFLTHIPGVLRHRELVIIGLSLNAGIFEELYKGAGIAVVFLLGRRYFNNLVSGVVIGAAVGLGFNFVESVHYMVNNAGLQFWVRQIVGMMTSHVAFSALLGAGFGIAAQLRSTRDKWLAVAIGYLTPVCLHFANNYALQKGGRWFALSDNPAVAVFVLYPAAILVLQGPALAMYITLLRTGLKRQAAALAEGLRGEAWSGHGAVTSAEIPALLRPQRRLGQQLLAFWTGGLSGWRRVGQLHAAQLDLAMHRWRRAHGDLTATREDELRLREHVLRLKSERRSSAPVPPLAAEAAV